MKTVSVKSGTENGQGCILGCKSFSGEDACDYIVFMARGGRMYCIKTGASRQTCKQACIRGGLLKVSPRNTSICFVVKTNLCVVKEWHGYKREKK